MAATLGLAGSAAYADTKAALASFTRSWAAEYSPSGVRVNTVAPGPVYSVDAALNAEGLNRKQGSDVSWPQPPQR